MASVATLSGFGLSGVSCKKADLEEFLQKHYLEMTEEDKKRTIKRLEEKYLTKYGKTVYDKHAGSEAGHIVGIRPRSLQVHRVQALRLRLRERE